MKIGIITHFHKSINYGGVLQAYALCKYLNNQGHCASQILYTAKVKKLAPPANSSKKIFRTVLKRAKRKYYRNRNRAIQRRMAGLFADFLASVPHTENAYTKETINQAKDAFDVVVAGSDQIWNPDWYDSSYMLDFVDSAVSKVSYAASMGVSVLSDEQKKVYEKYLSRFKSISVREKECANVLGDVLDKPVEVSVDPTLLLTAEDWNEIASDRKVEEKYVFLYMLGDDIKVKKTAQKFAESKGLKLVYIPDLIGEYVRSDRKIKGRMVEDATPCDFISLIKHAEYVFTDSFHACVFSLLYKKDFFAFDRRGTQKTSSRICNLTEMFGCKERFCVTDTERSVDYLLKCPPINYLKDTPLFDTIRQKSMDYLKENI